MNRNKFIKIFGLGVGAAIVVPALLIKRNETKGPAMRTFTHPNGTKITMAIDPVFDNPNSVIVFPDTGTWIRKQEYDFMNEFYRQKDIVWKYYRKSGKLEYING